MTHQQSSRSIGPHLTALTLVAALMLGAASSLQAQVTPAFTYQGELRANGSPANASFDMEFRLYSAASAGTQIGPVVAQSNVQVANGLFNVQLDFGPAQFAGDRQWLEVRIKPAGSGSFETLLPRTEVSATPYALGAVAALANSVTTTSIVNGTVQGVDLAPASIGTTQINNTQVQRRVLGSCTGSEGLQAIGADGSVSCASFAGGGGTVTSIATGTGLTGGPIMDSGTISVAPAGIGATEINPAQVQRRVSGVCSGANFVQQVNQDGTVACAPAPGAAGWSLSGNGGTNPVNDFLGTLDQQALVLRTANAQSLRLEPSAEQFGGLPITTNVIGGSHANSAEPGIRGATIGGGGMPAGDSDPGVAFDGPNRVIGHYGTVSGGYDHEAGAFASVGGGASNSAVGGTATIAGGLNNSAAGQYASIGGGESNQANGSSGTVAGGGFNVASGLGSAIGGGAANTAGALASTISGGLENLASAPYGNVGGGRNNTVSADSATIGGGQLNVASGQGSTIGGGAEHAASGIHTTIGGGLDNTVSAQYAALLGGRANTAVGEYTTVGGGYNNHATYESGAVFGGQGNKAGQRAFVGGGLGNDATALYATIAGGGGNLASGQSSSIAGGGSNTATAEYSAIGGGLWNEAQGGLSVVAGGAQNVAVGTSATVTGGQQASAVGRYSTAGGYLTCAGGARSWVGGYRSATRAGTEFPPDGDGCIGVSSSGDADGDEGSFVWSDGQSPRFETTGANQFAVRAIGGFYFGTNSTISIPAGRLISTSTGAYLSSGGTWVNASSRSLKAGFVPVDVADALSRVLTLPVTRWTYRASPDEGEHLGPAAEDFHAAFGLGVDGQSISTTDAAGVALAAIQGLNQKLEAENAELRTEIAALRRLVESAIAGRR